MKSRIVIISLAIVLAVVGMAASASGLAAHGRQEPSEGSKSVWDGVYTEEQAGRGEALYLQVCGNCHGASLEGADEASPLVGLAFTAKWNGLTLGDLLERIRITMPADRPGSVRRQDNVDILTYILKFNKFPAGETELPRRTRMLKEILLLEAKP